MRPNQNSNNKNRSRGRSNNSNNGGRKHLNPLNRSFESNGPDVKLRGNAAHIAEKYVQLARDAQASGDSVMAENYFQHAEHYFRIISAAQPQGVTRTDQYGQDYDQDDYDGEESEPVDPLAQHAQRPPQEQGEVRADRQDQRQDRSQDRQQEPRQDQRQDRPERQDRAERFARPERSDRPDRAERTDRPERTPEERPVEASAERQDRPERTEAPSRRRRERRVPLSGAEGGESQPDMASAPQPAVDAPVSQSPAPVQPAPAQPAEAAPVEAEAKPRRTRRRVVRDAAPEGQDGEPSPELPAFLTAGGTANAAE